MKQDEDDNSSQEEGFFKPNDIKVQETEEDRIEIDILGQPEGEQANELIQHNRPTDYLPRVISSAPPLRPLIHQINGRSSSHQQQLVPLTAQRTKKTKYQSLAVKYLNNPLYSLVYSKQENTPQEFNSYIFSLNHTTDYSPKDYMTAAECDKDSASRFDSKFQSGNLLQVYQVKDSKEEQYDLLLQNDTNTRGYNSWYFFSFQTKHSKSVKFNIVNLIKKHALYQDGVRPVGLSTNKKQIGWQSIGTNISYQKSYVSRQIQSNPPMDKSYYTLSFTVDFTNYPQDKYYIAMNYPYTYTKMINFIERLGITRMDLKIEKHILCYTISNNAIPVLRIRHQEYKEGGKKILAMARQHPGQTVGSFVLQGFLKKAVTELEILKSYQLIVIPMVNPDGVIYGNFRTNLSGFDLNRQWLQPSRWMHPQIYFLSKFINSLKNVAFVLDFHGHSKKYNSFIFACSGDPSYPFRVYPYIFSKASQYFSIKDCTYNLTPDKERTARIQIFRSIKKPQVFTLETSFFGYQEATGRKYRFKIHNLLEIGSGAVQSMKTFLLCRKQMLSFEKQVKDKEYLFDQWAYQMKKDDIESQSNPSQDQLTPVERTEKVITVNPTKTSKPKTKSKKKIKKKNQNSIINIAKLKSSIQDSNQVVELKTSMRKNTTGPVVISRKKIESERIIPSKQNKIKQKKVDKIISIITPKPPKAIPSKRDMSVPAQSHSQVPIKMQFQKLNKKQSQQRLSQKRQDERIQTITSNLFQKPNYFSHFQEKMFKQQAQKRKEMYDKTQSLQISSIKRGSTFSHGSNIDVLRKLIAVDEEQAKQIKPEPSRRNRDKMYSIRQNKIINSTARLNEENMKKNLQQQISNRTKALRNCQRKMYEITLDDPLIRGDSDSYALQYLNSQLRQTYSAKQPGLPAIKGEKKSDYFNF